MGDAATATVRGRLVLCLKVTEDIESDSLQECRDGDIDDGG